MSDIPYTIDDWNNALEAAENNDFDPVDSEQGDGPLAGWVAEQYTHPKVNKNVEVLEAVINVLQQHSHEPFSTKMFMTVLLSYTGDTQTCFRFLVEDHMSEVYNFNGPFPGNPGEDEYKKWYLANCCNEGEVYAEVASGSGLYWFDRNQW